jgi:plasmid stability protein
MADVRLRNMPDEMHRAIREKALKQKTSIEMIVYAILSKALKIKIPDGYVPYKKTGKFPKGRIPKC